VSAPDPIDARLLAVLAELGRAAVHDIAARMGMDPREVAVRLVSLSATGLPLLVGAECDPNGIRAALAAAGWGGYLTPPGYPPNPYAAPPGAYPVPSGPQPVQQGYPGLAPPLAGPPVTGPQPASAPFPAPAPTGPTGGPLPTPPPISEPVPASPPSRPLPTPSEPTSGPLPAPAGQPQPATETQPADAMSTWGPPQTSSWARGDQQAAGPAAGQTARGTGGSDPSTATARTGAAAASSEQPQPGQIPRRTGTVGEALETAGLAGERLSIRLVEVVDPADFLFTAAGYRLQEGERAVVVHTELTNRGSVPFTTLPDLYLVLITADGRTVAKAPVTLSSRPPHRIGVQPGETTGGHTVYVLPEATNTIAVRWSPRPDDQAHSLTWTVVD
jgi:hypothetical protein